MPLLKLTSTACIGAGALALAALATPASADQSVVQYPAACQSMYPNANCRNHGPGNPRRYYGYVPPAVYNYGGPGYPAASYSYSTYPTGFAPLDVAGAAVGTAGLVATAPFHSYAWEYGPAY